MRLTDYLLAHGWLPFMTVATGAKHVSVVRIVEALVIAGVTAVASSLLMVRTLEVELGHVREKMLTLERKLDKITDDIYIPRNK